MPRTRLIALVTSIVFPLLAFLVWYWFTKRNFPEDLNLKDFSDHPERSLKAMEIQIELCKQLLSWGVVLIGGVGVIVLKHAQSNKPVNLFGKVLVVGVMTTTILSMITGCIALHSATVELAYTGVEAAFARLDMIIPQLHLLLASVVQAGLFFIAMLFVAEPPLTSTPD